MVYGLQSCKCHHRINLISILLCNLAPINTNQEGHVANYVLNKSANFDSYIHFLSKLTERAFDKMPVQCPLIKWFLIWWRVHPVLEQKSLKLRVWLKLSRNLIDVLAQSDEVEVALWRFPPKKSVKNVQRHEATKLGNFP